MRDRRKKFNTEKEEEETVVLQLTRNGQNYQMTVKKSRLEYKLNRHRDFNARILA